LSLHHGEEGGTGRLEAPPWRPELVTASWLTTVLRKAGVLSTSASVEGFAVEPVGTGQMADSFRFDLHLEGADHPSTVVGKFTAADEKSRTTGISMRTAEVEVRFYQQVAGTLPVRTAECYYAEVDPTTAHFTLVLEDLAPRLPGDQVTGCTVDEAATALEEVAKLHGPRWGDPSLAQLEWLNRQDAHANDTLADIFPLLWAGFLDRYQERLTDKVVRVGQSFFPRIGRYFLADQGPLTFEHADYRVDNLLFGGPSDSPVAVVDWQTVRLGEAAADVSYFLGGSIDSDVRRDREQDLLRHYLTVLAGVGNKAAQAYSFYELWRGYRRHAYAGLIMAVGAAMMVARTDRGDDMFLAMATRAACHADDLDAFALLGA
jgi:hypothetical protein